MLGGRNYRLDVWLTGIIAHITCLFFFVAALAEPLPNEEGGATLNSGSSYFVRLGKLSARVRERALELSLIKARNAREGTHAAVTQITSTLDMLETTRTARTTASQIGGAPEQLLKHWKEWKEGQPGGKGGQRAEEEETDGTNDQGEVGVDWNLSVRLTETQKPG